MARIGIFGGSFNPVHCGHIHAAREFHRMLKLDELLLVPASVPPHKTMPAGSPDSSQRLAMLQLAAAELPFARIDTMELERDGASFTVDTLHQLRLRYPDDQLFLCVGTDMLLCFEKWRCPKEICSMAELAMCHRTGTDDSVLMNQIHRIEQELHGTVHILENDVMELSSTDVRRMLIFGCAEETVLPQVYQYITDHGFYGVNENRRHLSFDELQAECESLLKPKRIAHVRGCCELAIRMARKFGADEMKAARAAMLHDVTKALNTEEQLQLCKKYSLMPEFCGAEQPQLLHAVTGAAVARAVFGEDEEICEAVRWHTTGKAGMTTLEQIIYLADMIEPTRNFPGVDELRAMAEENLDAAVCAALERTIAHLQEQGQSVAEKSQEALQYFLRRKENG